MPEFFSRGAHEGSTQGPTQGLYDGDYILGPTFVSLYTKTGSMSFWLAVNVDRSLDTHEVPTNHGFWNPPCIVCCA